jgi:hypothetical protein
VLPVGKRLDSDGVDEVQNLCFGEQFGIALWKPHQGFLPAGQHFGEQLKELGRLP